MRSARLMFEIRAVFWRAEDKWRGEALEVEATSQAPTLDGAVSELLTHAHRNASEAMAAGDFPGRPITEVPDDIRGRWERLYDLKGGTTLPLAEVYLGANRFNEVALKLTISAGATFAELPRDLPKCRVLLFKEEEWWIAQGLEFDLSAVGRTQEEAMDRFSAQFFGRALVDAVLGRAPFAGLLEAPRRCWEAYEKAEELGPREHPSFSFFAAA